MSTEEEEIHSGNDNNLVQNLNVITQVEASPVRNVRNENSQNASVAVAVNETMDRYEFRTESPHEEDDNREPSNHSTQQKLYQDEGETNVEERKKNAEQKNIRKNQWKRMISKLIKTLKPSVC